MKIMVGDFDLMYISDDKTNRSYSTLLSVASTSINFDNTTDEWIHFLYDHIGYLLESADTLHITPEDAFHYRYRLNEFLKSKLHLNNALCQIIRVVNEMEDQYKFNGSVLSLAIPKDMRLQHVRQTFNSEQNRRKALH